MPKFYTRIRGVETYYQDVLSLAHWVIPLTPLPAQKGGQQRGSDMTLQARRLDRRMSQETLARRVGVAVSTISKWERGLHVPRPIYQRLLARALGVPLATVVGDLTP